MMTCVATIFRTCATLSKPGNDSRQPSQPASGTHAFLAAPAAEAWSCCQVDGRAFVKRRPKPLEDRCCWVHCCFVLFCFVLFCFCRCSPLVFVYFDEMRDAQQVFSSLLRQSFIFSNSSFQTQPMFAQSSGKNNTKLQNYRCIPQDSSSSRFGKCIR